MATGTIKSTGWKLLWTNPNPSSAFAAQTVALDLSAYQEGRILYKTFDTTALNNCCVCDAMVGFGVNFNLVTVDSSGANWAMRRTGNITTGGVTFTNCVTKQTNVTSAPIENNARLIPVYIYAR